MYLQRSSGFFLSKNSNGTTCRIYCCWLFEKKKKKHLVAAAAVVYWWNTTKNSRITTRRKPCNFACNQKEPRESSIVQLIMIKNILLKRTSGQAENVLQHTRSSVRICPHGNVAKEGSKLEQIITWENKKLSVKLLAKRNNWSQEDKRVNNAQYAVTRSMKTESSHRNGWIMCRSCKFLKQQTA